MSLPIMNQIASISESFIIANFIVASLSPKSKKHSLIYTFFLALLLYIDLYILNGRIIHNENIIAIIQIAICFIFEVLFLSGSLYKKILLPLLSTVLTLLINMFLLIFYSNIYQIDIPFLTASVSASTIMMILFSRILYFFFSSFIISIQHKNDFHLSKSEWIGVMVIYISTLCVGCSVFAMNVQTGKYTDSYMIIIITGLVLINLFSFYFIRKISKEKVEKIKYSILELQHENQKKDVITLNKQYNEIMKLRHDFKNYILCCQTLLNEKKYEEAANYLNTLSQDKLNKMNFTYYSDNSALNAIINAKLNVCEQYNFHTSCIVSDSCTDIDEIDLSILLANLLDNAIEACQKNKKESFIITTISKEKSYIHIQVKNTIEKSILKKNPNLITSKHDKTSHGYGIQTITDITKKYDGMQEFFERDNNFIADIWLNTLANSHLNVK